MQLDHLAFDIETIPARTIDEYSDTVRRFVEERIARLSESDPTMTYEKYAALNADFGRIICISVGFVHEGTIRLKSFCDEDERVVLSGFNEVLGRVGGLFVHYNGLGFDVPYIIRRMTHHRMRPASPRFAELRRYQRDPHCDLMQLYYNWDRGALPLGILAELHGLPSPKGDLDGSKVYEAYLGGELERIARYCEFDVATTLNLWRRLILHLEPLDCEPYRQLAPPPSSPSTSVDILDGVVTPTIASEP